MNTTELLEQFREEMNDVATPYLWSDTLVYRYIGDAQKQFCRFTNGISDSRTPAVTQVTIQPGVEWYAAHSSILKVRFMTRCDTGRDVNAANFDQRAYSGIVFDGRTGPLKALVHGLEGHYLRAWPVPDTSTRVTGTTVGVTPLGASSVTLISTDGIKVGQSISGLGIAPFTTVLSVAGAVVVLTLPTTAEIPDAAALTFDLTVNLSVFRLPITAITDDGDQEFEIDEQHHEHLLLWVKHRAYSKQDAETFDRTKAKEFDDAFRGYCARAKSEQDRLRRVPTPVAYGGI
jgi:hypothetical protein